MSVIKIGIVITARDVFPPRSKAAVNAAAIRERLNGIFSRYPQVECLWGDEFTKDGMVTEIDESRAVADYFAANKVDALFIPHANFGQEEAVGIIAHRLNVPVLIWGPRDGDPELKTSFRDYDTQCGLFASTRILLRYGITYTYLTNCWIGSPELDEGIDRFIRVAAVVKQFKNMRVLQLSTRPRQFMSVKVNESELLERFGIDVVPVESTEIIKEVQSFIDSPAEARAAVQGWKDAGVDLSALAEEYQVKLAALVLAIRSLADKYRCTTVASECWRLVSTNFGVHPCYAFACSSQAGLPVACEDDVHGAISSILAQAADLYETPSFLADITVRHPTNDNGELLWHCGPFPPVLAAEQPRVSNGQGQYRIKDGHLTLVRFETDHNNYVLFAEECDTTDGPETTGNYVWIETKDWGKWEDRLMYGPYIHHIAGIYGAYKEVFKEACRYIGVSFDCVD